MGDGGELANVLRTDGVAEDELERGKGVKVVTMIGVCDLLGLANTAGDDFLHRLYGLDHLSLNSMIQSKRIPLTRLKTTRPLARRPWERL